ncbi:MAG: ATP-binding protein [Terriglobales bacterium]
MQSEENDPEATVRDTFPAAGHWSRRAGLLASLCVLLGMIALVLAERCALNLRLSGTLLLGAAFCSLLLLTSHLVRRGQQRAHKLQAVNRSLEHEIVRRQRIELEQARLTAIVEASPDFICTTDNSGQVLYYNGSARRLLGLAADADISQRRVPCNHPEWAADIVLNEALPTAAREGWWRGESALVTVDGREIPVSHLVLAHKSGGNTVESYSNICRDISREKRAEAELRRLNRALSTLTKCTQTLIHTSEEHCLLKEVCNLIIEVGGYRCAWVGFAEQDENKTVRPVVWAGYDQGYVESANVVWADVECGRDPTGTCIRTGKPVVTRFTETEATNQPWREEALKRGYMSAIGLPLIVEKKAFGALTIYANECDAFDATEGELLMELANDLAFGISMLRTRAERERYAAELERSNRDLQDFASIASHDLQEPLRKITAFGDRLRAHCGPQLDATGRDFLARMENAATRMCTLIERLLEFSRVSTRAQPFEPVDLSYLVLGVVADLEARIREIHARVSVGAMPVVMADRMQIRELLQNLIANALKFHRPGETPRVEIEGAVEEDMVRIVVRDNGIGFDEKHADRIFRPFQRLHSRSEYEGTGMGLAICRKIVRRHGGEITARSQPGHGSEFIVYLPKVQRSEEISCSTQDNPSVSCSPKMTTTITSSRRTHFVKRAS